MSVWTECSPLHRRHLLSEMFLMRSAALRVDPALLHNGRHSLLIFTFVLLIELCGLTVGWTVRVRFIQQRLNTVTQELTDNIRENKDFRLLSGYSPENISHQSSNVKKTNFSSFLDKNGHYFAFLFTPFLPHVSEQSERVLQKWTCQWTVNVNIIGTIGNKGHWRQWK